MFLLTNSRVKQLSMSSLIVTKSADIRNRLIQGFSYLKHLKHIHAALLRLGLDEDTYLLNQVLRFSFNFGNTSYSYRLLYQTKEPNIFLFNTMIRGLVLNYCFQESIEVYHSMRKEGLSPDSFTFPFVLKACARVLDSELGLKMHSLVVKADGVVWNAAISGLAMSGHVKDAFGLFGQMEKSGIKPDRNTFVGLLCACTHAGLVDEGRQYFNSMERVFKLTPEIEHYGCMVDLLGRAGCLDEAHQLIKGMPIEANAIVWGALLGGCRLHRDTQLGEVVLKQLIALEPWHSGNYVLLSNIYSASHKWEDAAKIRSIQSERGVKKIPGYSWMKWMELFINSLWGIRPIPYQRRYMQNLVNWPRT
ncbi:hypothetical protein IMY05_001G0115700 [Salix suchowensis]|nr:hypothetical protein IMY05_001G0115700 [Salix suchowensis]